MSVPQASQIPYATGVEPRPRGPFGNEFSRQGVFPTATCRSEREMPDVAENIDISYELTRDGETFLLILLTRLVYRLCDVWLRRLWLRAGLSGVRFVLLARLTPIIRLGV